MPRPTPDKPDILEHGSPRDGQPQATDRRLFIQLLVFTGCRDTKPVFDAAAKLNTPAVVYEDVLDPTGVALLTLSEDPAFFVSTLRPVLQREPFTSITLKPGFTMFGRTYTLGYETDLEETLFTRPTRTALNPAWPWAVWYPLRRAGAFAQLPGEEQRAILMEHGVIGMAFGAHDMAHDIRLMCHGMDTNDNDFVVGLVGKNLHPLSAVVQAMRKTKQTSQYLERLGPFFVGHAAWQSKELERK
ncbi:MAG: hypothetical protein GC164_11710 [Phycisphaera sp.]|nr:hypothetical protein [Phycisphaera sp.]